MLENSTILNKNMLIEGFSFSSFAIIQAIKYTYKNKSTTVRLLGQNNLIIIGYLELSDKLFKINDCVLVEATVKYNKHFQKYLKISRMLSPQNIEDIELIREAIYPKFYLDKLNFLLQEQMYLVKPLSPINTLNFFDLTKELYYKLIQGEMTADQILKLYKLKGAD